MDSSTCCNNTDALSRVSIEVAPLQILRAPVEVLEAAKRQDPRDRATISLGRREDPFCPTHTT